MYPTQVALTALALAALAVTTPGEVSAQKRQRDLITREELEEIDRQAQDLYRAIRQLRPQFLQPPRGNRTMGAYTPEPTVVYVDGLRSGELESLKLLNSRDVVEVRYLDPSKAQEEFGMTHSGGAILVKTIKNRSTVKPDSGKPPL